MLRDELPRRSTGSLAAPTRLLLLLLVGLARAEGEEAAGAGAGEAANEDDKESRKEKAQGLSFCEYDNCYELLGVRKESGPIPIKRAYRRLAAEWHPDRCPSGDIAKCRELFPKYANAYEVLSNPEMRKNYDYVLANPYEFPGFYLKYSSPKYAPKSDVRAVIVITVIALSVVQYLLKKSQREQALAALKVHPRTRYNERLKELLAAAGSPKKVASSSKAKGAAKAEELEKRRKEAEEALDAELSAELPPPAELSDTLGVQLFKLPLTTVGAIQWYLAGGAREPAYMTRKALGLSAAEWDTLAEDEAAELVGRELWVAENLATYEAETRSVDARSKTGKQKRAERQAKKNPTNPASILAD